jgi:hypothetical protein
MRLLEGGEPDETARRAIMRDVAVAWRNEEIRERIHRSIAMPAEEADDADVENQQLQPYLAPTVADPDAA